jgi:hypothetical protein
MKKLLLIFLFLPALAWAEIESVKITTFRPAGDRRMTSVAELCGYVVFKDETAIRVEATVDGDRVPTYSVPATKDGRYCMIVNTYQGRVQVNAIGKDTEKTSSAGF